MTKESPSGVAKAIGLSNAAANGWKNGKIPTDVTLQKLSAHFHVPMESLTDENMFFQNYVRLCNKAGISPSAAAVEMGIAKPTVSRWKSGSKPNSATLQKIADYFHVPVESLTEEKPTPTGQQASGGVEVTPLEAELLAAYRRLSPAQRQALLALLGIESQP